MSCIDKLVIMFIIMFCLIMIDVSQCLFYDGRCAAVLVPYANWKLQRKKHILLLPHSLIELLCETRNVIISAVCVVLYFYRRTLFQLPK